MMSALGGEESRKLKQNEAGFAFLNDAIKAHKAEQMALKKKLDAVSVSADDIAIVAKELDLEEKAAKRELQKHEGNVETTLEAFIQRGGRQQAQ